MEEKIIIKCPCCGRLLTLKEQEGIESKYVVCPICKNKAPFNEYKIDRGVKNHSLDEEVRSKMDQDIITIKCRNCDAVLKVRNCSGIEDKYITCPVCKQRSRFSFYKRLSSSPEDENKVLIDSIMHGHFIREEERDGNRDSGQPSQYFHIEEPYSISVITLHEDESILFKVTNKSHPKDIHIDDHQLDTIRTYIRELVERRKYGNRYYLCPKCGNVMKVIEYPRSTGDDIGCECAFCKNQYYFGGTVFSEKKITRLTEISSNPRMAARKFYIAITKLMAKKFQKDVYLIDKVRLIMKYSDEAWIVSHIVVMNYDE